MGRKCTGSATRVLYPEKNREILCRHRMRNAEVELKINLASVKNSKRGFYRYMDHKGKVKKYAPYK